MISLSRFKAVQGGFGSRAVDQYRSRCKHESALCKKVSSNKDTGCRVGAYTSVIQP